MHINASADVKSHLSATLRSIFSNRRLILAVGIVAIAAGLYLRRDWLVSAGVAPVLIGLLPCAAMCALGLCMDGMKKGNGNGGTEDSGHTNGNKLDQG